MFDRAVLLAQVDEINPCGPDLRKHLLYDKFSRLARSQEKPDWAHLMDKAVLVAHASRDLRAWIWLTRTSLCAEGVHGLAAGLELIAEGLDRYWDVLPPLRAEEADPCRRFVGRLTALTELGATNYQCTLGDLLKGGRNLTDLRADLDKALTEAPADDATSIAIARARDAADAIARIFKERFGQKHDPQLELEVVLEKLVAVQQQPAKTNGDIGGSDELPRAARQMIIGSVSSRGEVVRALDLVLDYYEANEPSSPVPLLVRRAKRFVSLSFADAIKELAPSGLKELQTTMGITGENR